MTDSTARSRSRSAWESRTDARGQPATPRSRAPALRRRPGSRPPRRGRSCGRHCGGGRPLHVRVGLRLRPALAARVRRGVDRADPGRGSARRRARDDRAGAHRSCHSACGGDVTRGCPSIVSSASSRTCSRRTRGLRGSRRRHRPTAAPTGAPAGAAAPATSVPNVTIQGATYSHQSVARVLARLAALPTLSDVRLTASARIEPAGSGAPRATERRRRRSRSRSPWSRSRSPRAFGRVARHEGAHRSSSSCAP